ncbi:MULTISPECIES: hypothetical protein [Chelativorans]|jgi:hypothetical protein|uniref:Uncharacterized protein n=1 Tax=Chelativorans sp. (strain BNC1) TaxID=266779 RepID=Q11IP9_CHESB|nr:MULTISPECIES: hypothetical protein [Chelativorans]
MQTVAELTRFTPRALYYADADALEYVRIDEPVVYRRIDGLLTLILGIDERKPVGFKIKGFRNIYLRKLKPSLRDDNDHFLRMVTVFEKIMSEIGDGIFSDSSRREAYKAATNIAMEDQVIVSDLPNAA